MFKGIVPTFSYRPKFPWFFVFSDKLFMMAFLKVPHHYIKSPSARAVPVQVQWLRTAVLDQPEAPQIQDPASNSDHLLEALTLLPVRDPPRPQNHLITSSWRSWPFTPPAGGSLGVSIPFSYHASGQDIIHRHLRHAQGALGAVRALSTPSNSPSYTLLILQPSPSPSIFLSVTPTVSSLSSFSCSPFFLRTGKHTQGPHPHTSQKSQAQGYLNPEERSSNVIPLDKRFSHDLGWSLEPRTFCITTSSGSASHFFPLLHEN